MKVGSNVLTTDKGKLDITRMSALVDQIAWLRWHNYEVILVSSGAVACGRNELQVNHMLDSVEQRQLFSAMGQVKLINLYYDLFREYNIRSAGRRESGSQRPCLGEAAPPPEGSSVCAQKAPARLGFPGALLQSRDVWMCFGALTCAFGLPSTAPGLPSF